MTLDGLDELDPAVVVPMTVPVDKRPQPLASLVFGRKWLAGGIRPVLHRPEQGFGVGVVIGDPRLFHLGTTGPKPVTALWPATIQP